MKEQTDGKQARAEMETAKAESERTFSPSPLPRRYKLYDKIRDHVSLRTVDIIIAVTALLIVALLIYGIATGSPQR